MKKVRKLILSSFLITGIGSSSLALLVTPRVPASARDVLFKDLQNLRHLSGGLGTRLHREIFGPLGDHVNGEAYYNFFTNRVTVIDVEDSKQDFFVNAGGLKDPGKLYITTEYEEFLKKMPEIERWSVLIHEARHNESPQNWPHVLCPKTFQLDGKPIVAPWGEALAGKYACDDKALGSYGITIVMARNIELHCDNCTKELKTQAGVYARNILLRIINPEAVRILKEDLKGVDKVVEVRK